jgi:hypothetical protein
MSTSPQIQDRTRVFARVLGPYLFIAAATLLVRPSYAGTLLRAFDENSAWPWITGAFVLPMGLVVVVLHPYWRGPAAATISVLGWLTVLKGVALMTFPQRYLSFGQGAVSAAPWWQASVFVMALLGLYLIAVGWGRDRRETQSPTPPTHAVRG